MARTTRVYGYVLDAQNVGVDMANVYVAPDTLNPQWDGQVNGTTTNRNGYYSLQIEMHDTVQLVFSMMGYTTIRQQLYSDRDVLNVNVVKHQKLKGGAHHFVLWNGVKAARPNVDGLCVLSQLVESQALDVPSAAVVSVARNHHVRQTDGKDKDRPRE